MGHANYIMDEQDELTRLKAQNERLREALQSAVNAGTYAVRLIEAAEKAGTSTNPFEHSDWIGTCAHIYGAMSFLNIARAALGEDNLK
jgi:hypothetical protein